MNISSTSQITLPSWTINIPGWKELEIEQFHASPTYMGVLEGNTQIINRAIIGELSERAAAVFCGRRKAGLIPVHFQQPNEPEMQNPFPAFLCMALAMAAPVQNDDMDDDTLYSRVACCWFTNDLNRNIESLILEGIRPFSWDDYAQNWGV
jgi:hypothetical protein